MFTIGDYKIVFKKQWHQPPTVNDIDGSLIPGDGRYDTVCEIYVAHDGGYYYQTPKFTGIAKLHPNDQVDRIVGKKLALRRALDVMLPNDEQRYGELLSVHYERMHKNKSERTAIWKAFWVWVSQWPADDTAKAIKLLISVKNLWLEIEGEAFYDLNGGRDFDKALDILTGLK